MVYSVEMHRGVWHGDQRRVAELSVAELSVAELSFAELSVAELVLQVRLGALLEECEEMLCERNR